MQHVQVTEQVKNAVALGGRLGFSIGIALKSWI